MEYAKLKATSEHHLGGLSSRVLVKTSSIQKVQTCKGRDHFWFMYM